MGGETQEPAIMTGPGIIRLLDPRRTSLPRPHPAGASGAAVAERFIDCGWVRRLRDSRAIVVTETGCLRIRETFGLDAGMLRGEAAAPGRPAASLAGSVPPGTDQPEGLPDDAAPEEKHADHEDRADHHRHG